MREEALFEHNYELVYRYHLVDLDGHVLLLVMFESELPRLSLIFKSLRQERSVPLCMLQSFSRQKQYLTKVVPVVIVLLDLHFEQLLCFEVHL